jgi:ELWxxDGT repeat protein
MKALIAMSLFICVTACTKPGGKGSAQGDDAPATGEETGDTDKSSGTGTGSTTGKNDKDVATDSSPPTSSGSTTNEGSGNTTPGSGTDSGSGSGSTSPGSTAADTDSDGVADEQDVCPGEDDALQVTRYKLTDADSDGYADGSLSAKVCPSNTDYTLTLAQVVYNDCDSSNAAKWQMLAYSYRDADNDGHSIASSGSLCTGASLPAGYLTSSLGTTDCDDTNPLYHTVTTYYSYTSDGATAPRYSRSHESRCVPSSGYGTIDSYKEYRLSPDVISSADLSFQSGFVEFSGKTYFQGSSGSYGAELWATDGTLAGTTLLKDIYTGASGSAPSNFVSVAGILFFTADDGSGIRLWKTDGTAAGTVKVKPTASVVPSLLTNVGDILYFAGTESSSGLELWKSDGTESGTVLVKDINTGSSSSSPSSLTNVNGTLFFAATENEVDFDLWKSDGTESGTVKIKDLDDTGYAPSEFMAMGSTLFFSAVHDDYGRELWKSDGTDSGTVMVKDIRVGDSDGLSAAGVAPFAVIGGTLYFRADNGTSGRELWKTDGTEAGTVLVKDIKSGTSGSNPSNLTAVNGTLFFTADNATDGSELWKSNGTESGTVLVKDIRSGATGSSMSLPIAVGSLLYFRADDGVHNAEVWKSDGTEAGTILVKDINPSGSSAAFGLATFSLQLIFTATTPDGVRIHLTPAPL